MNLTEAITNRRSIRAFLDREVDEQVLLRIFERAQRAPSWCNIQPWRVTVASGDKRRALTDAFSRAAAEGEAPNPDVPFPFDYPEPYGLHRKLCGKALYDAMGIQRGDGAARQRAWLRNFVAFDAPHVAICGIDKRFDLYAALDVGCWLQTVLLLAQAEGLGACAQASLAVYPAISRQILGISDDIKILFGIAIGYEDTSAPANQCRTLREPASANISFAR